MKEETKKCVNCQKNFTIEEEDFNFYEKIKVPPPTWCPECRLIRRLAWRNEHSLFKRPNGTPGSTGTHISIYNPEEKITTYDKEFWWSDKWEPLDYGRDYDFSKPFFQQFKELLERVPHIAFFDSKSINARFCNFTVELKNCYLITAAWRCEDSMYGNRLYECKFTHDSYICFHTEYCYENVYCHGSNKLFFSRECDGCIDSYFLYDCRNCSDCLLCTNLRNKKYCIANIQYTREEYLKKKQELVLNTRDGIEEARKKFEEMYRNAFHKHLQLINTNNVVGDHVYNSRNSSHIFDFHDGAENSKFVHWGNDGLKDSYDVGPGCGDESELNYEGISTGVKNYKAILGTTIWYSQNVWYSSMVSNSHDCFGCVEMDKKQYCILNKQYTKEEYENLIPKIVQHMMDMPYVDKKGRKYGHGEFFPPEISPFAYNETVAQDYFPITKKEAEEKGFSWREYRGGEYQTTIKGKDLPQTIAEVTDSILNEVIECEITKKPFKILEQELSFYRRFDLPLPPIHPDERHNRRLKLRNPMILRKRMCFFGDKEVDTTYLPVEEGGPEKVVCTEHYNKEVY
ncbi:hypothetical protein A3I95_00050 [Candidatus Nomurabacteria bacterium RIFCSPLOWO2_02_FULL_44_12]|uniref:Uncharacterized protein n=1 Tax=Candidatus Nomurabacteria bacterium RIFCSPLOWO2_12_FULL_44_11 TaxID=1801796 RepID=A0A1F6Y4Q3_9BACT|nr:MAG: hypothetical protein A3G53_02305 [Candidatus Nomurabacteria bacterium RIFCSPLOWO2_12_FULL_44_11]OGJ08470.1 MAG: hypothetical protein A3I95_00050 [Candidatus Nomurabacteria bacterium RIFCSPLOWO2_02_FULL_44_12]